MKMGDFRVDNNHELSKVFSTIPTIPKNFRESKKSFWWGLSSLVEMNFSVESSQFRRAFRRIVVGWTLFVSSDVVFKSNL